MPAAAVIPAPIVYTSFVAVKTFVVEFYTLNHIAELVWCEVITVSGLAVLQAEQRLGV